MPVVTQPLSYEADGIGMVGHLAFDPGAQGPRPGVLVFPEAYGLSDHARSRAERLAAEFGYVALACDFYGDGRLYAAIDEVLPVLQALARDVAAVRARTAGALAALAARPEVNAAQVAAIGFCFGGTLAYELALSGADIVAAIGFHSGLGVTSPQDAHRIKGKVLALLGADDPGIPPEQRAAFETAMREGKVDWQMHLYGGVVHSFTNPDADTRGKPDYLRYDGAADARSWRQMAALLDEVFA